MVELAILNARYWSMPMDIRLEPQIYILIYIYLCLEPRMMTTTPWLLRLRYPAPQMLHDKNGLRVRKGKVESCVTLDVYDWPVATVKLAENTRRRSPFVPAVAVVDSGDRSTQRVWLQSKLQRASANKIRKCFGQKKKTTRRYRVRAGRYLTGRVGGRSRLAYRPGRRWKGSGRRHYGENIVGVQCDQPRRGAVGTLVSAEFFRNFPSSSTPQIERMQCDDSRENSRGSHGQQAKLIRRQIT